MLSHPRRRYHHEFDEGLMAKNIMDGYGEHWKSSNRNDSSFPSDNLLPDAHPLRSNLSTYNRDLSSASRFDAYLLAIIRTEDRPNAFYSAEVVSKLREKEQTDSFINKPCSLLVTDRSLLIIDQDTQVIAETVPLENVDPACVHADVPDTLNDIFMYRLLDQQLLTTTTQANTTNIDDSSSVIVFKCSNNEARLLVDKIRHATDKLLKNPRSHHMKRRDVAERRIPDTNYASGTNLIPQRRMEFQQINSKDPSSIKNNQQKRPMTQQSVTVAVDYYKRLTEELNKCFDDIESFIRYLEALMQYTKELERNHRRKNKTSSTGLKQMIEKLPDDRYFIDILQKFKHSFNLLGELKHKIHNPNAPELIHYLLSPLQFIVYILRTKHTNQLQIAQDIWVPAVTKEAKELLLNCLTSKEHEILHNLGPAWIRTSGDSMPKFTDYQPVFFEGQSVWIQDTPSQLSQPTPLQQVRNTNQANATHPFTVLDEGQRVTSAASHKSNLNGNNNLQKVYSSTLIREPSVTAGQFDISTGDYSAKNPVLENYNARMQNEHAWAIDRKKVGAKICAVKIDRKAQDHRELTVRRGELIEIEDDSKKWWFARNFHDEIGYVPHNILDEIEIERRPSKASPSVPSGINTEFSLTNTNTHSRSNRL